jgi:hypothetical protein
MSEWVNFVKAYAEKNNISYKQALRDASPSYKTRNEIKPEVKIPKEEVSMIKFSPFSLVIFPHY